MTKIAYSKKIVYLVAIQILLPTKPFFVEYQRILVAYLAAIQRVLRFFNFGVYSPYYNSSIS